MFYLTSSTQVVLFGTNIVLTIAAVILHLACLYLLLSIGRDMTVQHKILVYFTCIHIVSRVSQAIMTAMLATTRQLHKGSINMIIFNDYTLSCTHKLILVVITVDRMLAITLGLKYHVIFTSARAHIVLLICWMLGVAVTIPLYFIDFMRYKQALNIAELCTDLLFTIFAALTFYKIFGAIKTSKIRSNQASLWKRQTFVLPGMIVASFVLFVVAGDAIRVIIKADTNVKLATNILYSFGSLSDGAIYVLNQPRVKHEFLCQVGKRRRSSAGNANALEALRQRAVQKQQMLRRCTVDSVLSDDGHDTLENDTDQASDCYVHLSLTIDLNMRKAATKVQTNNNSINSPSICGRTSKLMYPTSNHNIRVKHRPLKRQKESLRDSDTSEKLLRTESRTVSSESDDSELYSMNDKQASNQVACWRKFPEDGSTVSTYTYV